MTLESQQCVVVIHSATVVGHANQPLPARFRLNANRACAGVNRVFEKFFYDGGRPFDNFTGRDFIRDILGKYANAAHRVWPTTGPVMRPS